MTKEEHKRLIETLDVWVKECVTFYNAFKDVFAERPDTVDEYNYRCLQVIAISEFLFSGQFITTEKYLDIADVLEKNGVGSSLKTKFIKIIANLQSKG